MFLSKKPHNAIGRRCATKRMSFSRGPAMARRDYHFGECQCLRPTLPWIFRDRSLLSGAELSAGTGPTHRPKGCARPRHAPAVTQVCFVPQAALPIFLHRYRRHLNEFTAR